MANHGDAGKNIWVTEIGWNSALDNPNYPHWEWCLAGYVVTRKDQTLYLDDSFDILFQEVGWPGNSGHVEKITWYQYQDTGDPTACQGGQAEAVVGRPLSLDWAPLAPTATVAAGTSTPTPVPPADWGLLDGNREPKHSYWAYKAYPERLIDLYLPQILKTLPDGGAAQPPQPEPYPPPPYPPPGESVPVPTSYAYPPPGP